MEENETDGAFRFSKVFDRVYLTNQHSPDKHESGRGRGRRGSCLGVSAIQECALYVRGADLSIDANGRLSVSSTPPMEVLTSCFAHLPLPLGSTPSKWVTTAWIYGRVRFPLSIIATIDCRASQREPLGQTSDQEHLGLTHA